MFWDPIILKKEVANIRKEVVIKRPAALLAKGRPIKYRVILGWK